MAQQTSPILQRWATKATAFATAWQNTFKTPPSFWCVALGLSVAQHETFCGDAWPGEHNWGAVQLGGLNPAEEAVLKAASITPSEANLAAAITALEAAGHMRTGGALHVDTSPVGGPYFAWFRAFPTDLDGATCFVETLAGVTRPKCKAVMDAALGAWTADCQALAQAMYDTHYYEGFHNPNLPGGAAADVADYSRDILAFAPLIFSSLMSIGWTDSSSQHPQFDFTSVMGYQSALTFLAGKLSHHEFDPLGVDNKLGKDTKAAIGAFQAYAGIPITGQMNDPTTQALQLAISKALGVV